MTVACRQGHAPARRPAEASLVSLARPCHGLAITDSNLGSVTFSAKCAPNADSARVDTRGMAEVG